MTPWITACQALLSWDFPGKNTGVGNNFLRIQKFYSCVRVCVCIHTHTYTYIYITKILIHRDIGISMFTVTLFIIAKIWKQAKYPSTDE